jgi:hypothetical protein
VLLFFNRRGPTPFSYVGHNAGKDNELFTRTGRVVPVSILKVSTRARRNLAIAHNSDPSFTYLEPQPASPSAAFLSIIPNWVFWFAGGEYDVVGVDMYGERMGGK